MTMYKTQRLSFKNSLGLISVSILVVTSISGCLGGGGGDSTPATRTGVFTDSPVSGLHYQTDTQQGITAADGSFQYRDDETVTFHLGELRLGSATAAKQLSPLDLVSDANLTDNRITNMLVLLQSLDEDRALNNGIQISEAIADTVSVWASSIQLDQDPADFASSTPVQSLLTALNTADPRVFTESDHRPRKLRSAADAQAHLERTLSERRVVSTQHGEVAGFSPDENTWAWYGIPYAKPPVGDLRWKPPVTPDAWEVVREATDWADQSAQRPALEVYSKGSMSEDSLYLNVIAPKGRESEKLPVMFWLHGGGYAILTANSLSYNHTALPANDVIVVTVNHRLGAFGYMAHPALTAESGHQSSGNYAQLDQIAALEWVRDNIGEFGGDPENVTIFGQSGGGMKVVSLLNSPLAEGLFHKAIIMSGTPSAQDPIRPIYNTLEQEEAGGISLATRLGLQDKEDTLAAMRAVPWTELAAAANDYGVDYFKPNVDGWYVKSDIRENGFHNDVPLMVGVPRNDGVWALEGFEWYMPFLSNMHDSDVFAYIYDHVPENWANRGIGAYHGIELASVFGSPDMYFSHYVLGLTGIPNANADTYADNLPGLGPIDESIATDSMALWTQFATTGNPSTSEIAWPAYTKEGEEFMLMNYDMNWREGLLDYLP